MTVSTQSSQLTVATGGSTGPFSFPFIGVSVSDIVASAVASNGSITPLSSSQYSVTLNAANPNSLWGVGGSVLLVSTPSYPNLLIERLLPLTQNITTQNQGNFYAQATEQALDLLEMQIQQGANRTTQFHGTWITGASYNVGDIVQDGVNGNDTLNYYICTVANTAGVWATDLSNGDWALSVLAVVPTTNINITGAVTGSGVTSINTTLATEAPNTILANPSSTSAAPIGLAISASNLVGRTAAGNISAISLGNNLSLSGSVLNAAAFSGGTGITIGMTSIASGNNGSILYDNAGTLGQIATTGSSLAVLNSSPAITNATLTSPTFTAPTLGTPISGNLSNCTNIPASLMTALGVGSIILAAYNNSVTNSTIPAGSTVAASKVQVCLQSGSNNLAGVTTWVASGDSLSGTWQTLQTIQFSATGTPYQVGLWQRTA